MTRACRSCRWKMRKANITSCLNLRSWVLRGSVPCRRFDGAHLDQDRASVPLFDCWNLESYVSTLIAGINSCVSIFRCRAFHGAVLKFLNYRHGYIGDQLVSCYLKLGHEDDGEKLFDEMPKRDLVSWNSLISGYSGRGCLTKCLNALSRMRSRECLTPNEVTFLSIISAYAHGGGADEGPCIHGLALKYGVLEEVKVVNALINLYGKAQDLVLACRLFEGLGMKNLVSWNSMIMIHTQRGLANEGFGYFNISRRLGIRPDQATILTVICACEALGVGKLAQGTHGFIVFSGFNANESIATALLDLYAKLGRLDDSQMIFREMVSPDRVAWTVMLAAYAIHGHGKEAIEHFELMVENRVRPDHVTFIHLLSACSHSGLVENGKRYFRKMTEVYRIEPRLDHYSCLVDLMGRSGHLQDAYELIKRMPMEPNSSVWGALLGACRVYRDAQLGKEVAERLFALEPSDPRNYILLSNIYSAAGLWRETSRTRVLMKKRGLERTNPGCSYIEHNNIIHRFVVGDWTHPESQRIHEKLKNTIKKIRDAGFESKTELVLQDVDEDVKEDMINQHSEKLAMAFGLLVISPVMPIIITKNLRICGDCHETAKAISLVEKRTIIIRDSKRFHHFSNGLCSCKDYW